MQKSNGTDNFQQNDPQHMAFLNSIEGELNSRAANLSLPLVGGVQSGAYIQDSRIRFKVLGIYFHQDDIGWTNNGSSCNNYCFANFSVDPEHSLNIFFYGHNIGNGVFGGCGPGMLGECSNFVALQNLYTQFLNSPPSGNYLGGSPWATMPLIFHEIGHCLGLRHSWDSNSQFPDKPTESFGNWCNPTNQSGCSNNVMSYSVDKSYLSPQQVGHIHQLLTGSWRGKLLESCFYDPSLTISVNNGQINTWDWGKTIGGDLIISNNSTLIVKCKISMPEGGKVIVQPGSRLIIDGGSFVNNCDGMWEGIEVWGNANLAQNFTNQGVVELKNGAFIEYAINGIRTIAEVNGNLDWSKTGGIILATGTASSVNCTFKDCWRGIEFMSYHSFNPSNPTTEIKNKSQITNCTFVTTVALPFFSTTPYSHITLYDVNGVAIRDNLFENQRSDVSLLPVDKRGSGIVSIDASYNVLARYFVLNGNIIPASENEFRNLYYGISTSGGTDRSDLIVKDNIFDNCAYSVSLAGCNWGLIGRNIFTVPGGDANITFPLVYDYAFGVHTNGAYGFNIEDNTFNDQSGNIFPNQAVHVINSSSVTSGQVYLNTVNGTSFGTQTQSNNSALKIDCNDYNKTTHSGIDIHAANGVLVDQGSCLFINDVPANNTFSGTCNNSNLAEIYKSSSVPNFSYSYFRLIQFYLYKYFISPLYTAKWMPNLYYQPSNYPETVCDLCL
jgi:hypothetical protein